MNGCEATVKWNTIPVLDYLNSGRGNKSIYLKDQEEEIREDYKSTFTMGMRYAQMDQEILEAVLESSEDNWDGEGAKAVNVSSWTLAKKLIGTIPPSITMPNVFVDPDGMIEFEWYKEPKKVFSVTVESDNTLIYAGLFGGQNKSYGTEQCEDELPDKILESLQRLYS